MSFFAKNRKKCTSLNIFDISIFLFFLGLYYAVLYFIRSKQVKELNHEFTYEDQKFQTEMLIPVDNIHNIRLLIKKYNKEQKILNQDKYGPLTNDSLIISIQVHNRYEYLKNVIYSLSRSKNISQAMLIFSHDYFDEAINQLVQSIDFCKVMQIFYPFSLQTHPNEFPGDSENDCPRNISKEQAISTKCTNAMYPDCHGHYREAKFTQIKHHWWWKMNMVFDGLDISKNFDGQVLFLEDDQYLVPDFIYMIKKLQNIQNTSCPFCKIIYLAIGVHHNLNNFIESDSGVVKIQTKLEWNNMGLVFDRKFWNEIKKCEQIFCTHDDYNWDYTMQKITNDGCLSKKSMMMVLKSSRVFHVGNCGVHKDRVCDNLKTMEKIEMMIDRSASTLYPIDITTKYVLQKERPEFKINGGWADKRDHQLCLNISNNH